MVRHKCVITAFCELAKHDQRGYIVHMPQVGAAGQTAVWHKPAGDSLKGSPHTCSAALDVCSDSKQFTAQAAAKREWRSIAAASREPAPRMR